MKTPREQEQEIIVKASPRQGDGWWMKTPREQEQEIIDFLESRYKESLSQARGYIGEIIKNLSEDSLERLKTFLSLKKGKKFSEKHRASLIERILGSGLAGALYDNLNDKDYWEDTVKWLSEDLQVAWHRKEPGSVDETKAISTRMKVRFFENTDGDIELNYKMFIPPSRIKTHYFFPHATPSELDILQGLLLETTAIWEASVAGNLKGKHALRQLFQTLYGARRLQRMASFERAWYTRVLSEIFDHVLDVKASGDWPLKPSGAAVQDWIDDNEWMKVMEEGWRGYLKFLLKRSSCNENEIAAALRLFDCKPQPRGKNVALSYAIRFAAYHFKVSANTIRYDLKHAPPHGPELVWLGDLAQRRRLTRKKRKGK
jgi:hypothetical protein